MITVSILGASGYAGGELLRILLSHPQVTIVQATSRRFAGMPVSAAHPNLRKVTPLVFSSPDTLTPCDVLFVAMPNGESMHRMRELMNISKVVIDMGADFRLNSSDLWERWYKETHTMPDMMKQFVYGLAELHREEIKTSNVISCGGCEATASILSLYPLVKHGIIEPEIFIDAKMSSSQAGLEPTFSSHHPERAGSVRSYMPTGHRHTAEIEQELSYFMQDVNIHISATAIDMVRGILVTIQTKTIKGITEKDVWKAYRAEYGTEPFVRIVKEKRGIYRYPEPKILAGTNFFDVGFELSGDGKRLVVVGAIDNLVKGTAGQAVQAMNIRMGFEESTALTFPGLHPI